MWDYSGSFGVVTKKEGKNKLDADTVKSTRPENACRDVLCS